MKASHVGAFPQTVQIAAQANPRQGKKHAESTTEIGRDVKTTH
jgi:hypothetical protein